MHIIIPARYASTRLPGKALVDVCGKPLVQRVFECAVRCQASRIIIATDDERIQQACEAFGAEVCLTSAAHQSGTDRIAEVIQRLGIADDEIVVNLQGDEPLMPAALINSLAQLLASRPEAVMATACHPIHERERLLDPNVVKVVLDHQGDALYFSRAAIPWPRDAMAAEHSTDDGQYLAYHHIGLYAYRAGFVSRYAAWPVCELEATERLEQLRVLWHGEKISVLVSDALPGTGVDTPEDLERVRHHFSQESSR